MENTIRRLAEFVSSTDFPDLPAEVVDFTKKLLLDTFGCAIAGVASDKGKWGIDFARRCFPGKGKATVLGYGDHFSGPGASFANGELINGLDYEAAGLHLPPFIIPPVLAIAEQEERSGKNFITATALGLEVGCRVAKGLISKKDQDTTGKKAGIAQVFGPCSSVFGGAAGSAKAKGFSLEKTAHAMGLAGVLSPVPSQASMHRDLPVNSGKYLMAGWAAQTGLTAAELVQSGHRGNLQVLDSEYGYWRFTGQESWQPEQVLNGLGRQWQFLTSTPYKKFPCCGMMHGGLECLDGLIKEHHFRPEDIRHIRVYLDPSSAEPMFHNRELENQIDLQFSVAYNMALVALRVRPGILWQAEGTFQDERVRAMMDRISVGVHPECKAAQEKDHRARVVSVEIEARGTIVKKELRFIKGTVTAGAAMEVSDAERIGKFRDNVSLVLPRRKEEEAIRRLLSLEEENTLGAVMDLLHV